MWDSCIHLEDAQHADSVGVVTTTNNSHREMLCRELLIPVIQLYWKPAHETGESSLKSLSVCSRFYQLALATQIGAASKKA